MTILKIYKSQVLIDGTGSDPIVNPYIIVDNNKIVEIGRQEDLATKKYEYEVIDLEGKTITPGIIDAHVHIVCDPVADFTGFVDQDSITEITVRGINNLRRTLFGGVTYFRDLGGYKHIDLKLKKCLNEGLIEGPDFLAAGEMITMTGGHGWKLGKECDGPTETRKAAREQIKMGADIIKLMATGGNLTPGIPRVSQLTEEEMRAAVEEAHKAGKKTTTHAHGPEGIKNALRAGIDCIEHGMYIDEDALQYMVENDIYYVPTLVAAWICAEVGEERGLSTDAVNKTKSAVARHMESFIMARKTGVKIGMGTDAGTPFCEHGNSYIDEMKLMIKGGFTPMQAIVAATKTSAEILGVSDQYGTIAKGKIADFLVLNDNPLINIDTFRNISDIYKKGKRINREAL